MVKHLAIDPGTEHLGWVMMEDGEVLDGQVACIWRDQKNVFESLTKAAIQCFREHYSLFEEADFVLIEHQFQGKGMMQVFRPYIVMAAIYSACEMAFPGKIETVSPSALKTWFGVSGNYEERKKQVVQLAGLSRFSGRMHDIADCVLMVQYKLDRTVVQEQQRQAQAAREAKRAAVRAKLLEKIPIKPKEAAAAARDASPARKAPAGKVCSICEKTTEKLCRGACIKCYQRAYRAQNKR